MPDSAPYQWTDLEALGLSTDEASARVWLITDGQHYGGHTAVAAMLRRQPSIAWRFIGQLMITPPFSVLAAIGYALTARYRYLLPGGTPACAVR